MDTQIRGIHHVTAMTSIGHKKSIVFTGHFGYAFSEKPSIKTTSKLIIFTSQMNMEHQELI